MSDTLRFFVPGIPRPAGSKRAFIVRPRQGREHVAVVDSSGQKGKDWRADIQRLALAQVQAAGMTGFVPLLSGPLALRVVFRLPRPKGHFTSRLSLRPHAPAYPTTRPDATKLLRALEDALTGILWRDDAQIVRQDVEKIYHDIPGVEVDVRLLARARAERQSA